MTLFSNFALHVIYMELVASVIFMRKQTQENAKYLDGRVQLRAKYMFR